MTTNSVIAETNTDSADQSAGARFTLDELARKVGMSTRNIRAHQARKIIPPPLRLGRVVMYHEGHIRRLEMIKSLQRQGFNLVAIEAMLGVRPMDPAIERLTATLRRVVAERPSLVRDLSRHGIIEWTADGAVRTVRPRVLRLALELHRARIGTVPSLQVLSEVLDSVRPVADELASAVFARVLALAPNPERRGTRSWAELDTDVPTLTESMVGLLAEAFKVALEQHVGPHSAELAEPTSPRVTSATSAAREETLSLR